MSLCTGTYGDSMLFLVCVIDSGGSKNKSHNATSARQYASDLYLNHCNAEAGKMQQTEKMYIFLQFQLNCDMHNIGAEIIQ